jgi:hypothetical protein
MQDRESAVPRSRVQQLERVLTFATRFLDEVRDDIARTRQEGSDSPPRIRCVSERAGHATPEFRTLTIPIPDGYAGMSPEVLSGAIARYAQRMHPDCLLLALEAENADGPLLVGEARCRMGTRLYWMQPFRIDGGRVEWGEVLEGGWRDPAGEEMILDHSFAHLSPPALAR